MSMTQKLQIRWMIRRDMDRILQIENECFESPLDRNGILDWLRQRNCIGMVASCGARDADITGFMIYELHATSLVILDFAIAPEYQREGVGSAMINRLIDKLIQSRRTEITALVSDQNLTAHLFFRSHGFKAVGVKRNHFESYSGELIDGYVFRYKLTGANDV